MDISNQRSYQGSWYVNPNTRTLTSNRKNTAIRDRDAFGCMRRLLRPAEDMTKALRTPIRLAERTSVNRAANSVTIAAGTRITVNDGYFLTVTENGVECHHGENYDPYDTEAYIKAQAQADSLSTLLRNAGGTQKTTAFSEEGYQKWTEKVSAVLSYMGIDGSRDFSVNGMKYHKNSKGYWESEENSRAKAAWEMQRRNNRTYTFADGRTKSQIGYISCYYLEHASGEMQAAWQRALEESGVNPFPEGYASTLSQIAMEQDFATGGNDVIFGADMERNIATVQSILDRIDHPFGDISEEDQVFREEEKVFYRTLLGYLTASEETLACNKSTEYYAEKAFASVGPRAPQEVKQAWMDAAKETGANGLGIGADGMMRHISQMMVQRLKRNLTGRGSDADDILGNSISSAIQAAGEALYNLEHPLVPESSRSIEVQYYRMKERAFYQTFIKNLEALL